MQRVCFLLAEVAVCRTFSGHQTAASSHSTSTDLDSGPRVRICEQITTQSPLRLRIILPFDALEMRPRPQDPQRGHGRYGRPQGGFSGNYFGFVSCLHFPMGQNSVFAILHITIACCRDLC